MNSAEQQLIGMLITSQDLLDDYTLAINDFTSLEHQTLFKNIFELHKQNVNIDIRSVIAKLVENDELETKGLSVEYITSISQVFTTSNFDYYYAIIKNDSKKRNVVSLANRILEEVKNTNVSEVIEKSQEYLFNINRDDRYKIKTLDELNEESYNDLVEKMNDPNKNNFLRTGFSNLDNMIDGFIKSKVIVLAARPAIGKTALALNFAIKASEQAKDNIVIFSLEMAGKELYERMLASVAKIDSYKYKYGKLTDKEIGIDNVARTKLKNMNIFIEDKSSIKIQEIKSICKSTQRHYGKIGLVIIDYLQLIEPSSRGENKQVQIAQISRELKQLAKDLDVCVITLAQLSRSVESRTDKKPILSDLRDSGAIEADADIVAMMYKDDESFINEDSERINLLVAKNRSGRTGELTYVFDKSINKFSEM